MIKERRHEGGKAARSKPDSSRKDDGHDTRREAPDASQQASRRMKDHSTDDPDEDLRGVDPRRRALVRRRLDVVRRYLALAAPTLEDDASFARELGLLPPSFLVLVRAYRTHRAAAAMPGAKVPMKRTVRDARTPSPETEAAVAQAIHDLGPDATSVALLDRVDEICRVTGALTPSLGVVHLRRAKARRSAESVGVEGLVLDHIGLDLPVRTADGPVSLPVLTLVIDGGVGAITGWSLATRPPTPQAAASALMMAAGREGETVRPLRMAIDAAPEWAALLETLAASGVKRIGTKAARLPAGSMAFRILGDRLGGMQLLPRRVHRTDPPRLRSRLLHSLTEAQDAVRAAVDMHNAGRIGSPLPALVQATERSRLVAALASFLARPEGGDTGPD